MENLGMYDSINLYKFDAMLVKIGCQLEYIEDGLHWKNHPNLGFATSKPQSKLNFKKI